MGDREEKKKKKERERKKEECAPRVRGNFPRRYENRTIRANSHGIRRDIARLKVRLSDARASAV